MKKSTVILMWGVITAVLMAIFSQFTYQMEGGVRFITYLIFFAGLLVAKLQYRNKVNGGYASFGQLYGLGMLLTLVVAVIVTINFFILLKMHPGFVENAIEQARAQMVMKKTPDEIIEKSLNVTRFFLENPLGIIAGGIVGMAFWGALLSLLSAGIAAKKKPMFEENTTDTIE